MPSVDNDISCRCLARIFRFYSQVSKSIRVAGESSRRIESLERAPKLPVFELHNSLVTASSLSDDSGLSSIYMNNTFSDPSIRH